MKLTSLLVAFCFTMNVFASTGTIQQLERTLDEYHYALSVDWDQKDVQFHEQKTNEFFKGIQELMSEGGLTQSQLVSVVEKKMKDKTKTEIETLQLKLSLMSGAQTPEELAKMIGESSSDFYNSGASWNGRVMIPFTIVLVGMAALGFAMWYSATHGCQEYAQICDQFGCRNNYGQCVNHGYVGPHL